MSRRRLAVLLAFVLAVPATILVVADEVEAAAPARVLAINTASAKPIVPFAAFDGNPVKVYDIDGDGDLEIIAQNDNQWVYIFDSRTGALLAELKTVFPPGWGARSFNGPEVSILQEGGQVRLILANSAATITSYVYDPVASTGIRLGFTKEWERRLSDCHPAPGMDSKPVLADLDRDGVFEILAATEELGIYALRANGAVMWKTCIGGGNGEPVVGDLNVDGWPDVVFGSDGGVVTAMNGRTGGTMWAFNVLSRFNLGSGSIPVGVALGQLDGVAGPDVVFGARDSHNATDFSQDHALLAALDSYGRLLWGKQDPTGNPLTYTHPVIVDTDADGKNEVYWGDWNTIGHKPPADEADSWKVTGPGNFYRYSANGTLVWKQSLGTFWSNKDTPLADVNGDGVQDMLANGPAADGHDGLWLLDTRTGAKQGFIDTYPWKVQRSTVVADLHGDGGMDLVIEASPMASGAGSGGAILVYDTGAPYSSAWPHLPYPELGPIGPPAPPPPPAGGYFDATFKLTNPNPYWQQVRVTPVGNHAVAKVEVRANEGPWNAMTKQSYGDWTSSYPTPAGSAVEFLITSTAAAESRSQVFTWLDGSLQKGSTTPGGSPTSTTTTTSPPASTSTSSTSPPSTGTGTTTATASTTSSTSASTTATSTASTSTTTSATTTSTGTGALAATYRVPSGVNEWWVEVGVAGNEAISAVESRVGAGSWVPLTKQSWGNWAKSFYVAPGSQVTFRATGASGAQGISEPFTWGAPPPPPPPGTAFAATFSPKAVGNDWWVETAVSANQAVTKVEAQINGGAWNVLPATNWGTYAKSLNAPNGASVVFRATNGAGATITSSPTIWT